jgi:hypothetical protein
MFGADQTPRGFSTLGDVYQVTAGQVVSSTSVNAYRGLVQQLRSHACWAIRRGEIWENTGGASIDYRSEDLRVWFC